jgi:hypothetical protein
MAKKKAQQRGIQASDLLGQLSKSARQQLASVKRVSQPTRQPPRWFLVKVPDVGKATCQVAEQPDALVQELRSLIGTEVSCFLFCGWQARLTKGPNRYIMLPDGRAIPLFDMPGPDDIDEYGYLGAFGEIDAETAALLRGLEDDDEEDEEDDDDEQYIEDEDDEDFEEEE